MAVTREEVGRERAATALVFVYGTLMRGERANHLLGRGRFLRETHSEPRFSLVDCGPYPGLVDGGVAAVRGELYEIPERDLPGLDDYEGPEYGRQRIRLRCGAQAYAWVMHAEEAHRWPPIPHADWRRRQR